ncbi:restriction endonuclease subunit S [Mycoplasma miroungirhinis]|uniref:Type I restriction modification DNA specificity domain-containing protein n=1 Tax=Mycoplasma miroungirhinis TaxID=754516 RepID=A0A6M4JCT3_9MOLU|nr:restriction endonuclease subunit S [Mycoplasma miroungirhinis]QJR44165.1 hypothetical protein HLA92_01825 [Mycoplasma miroungirhinis]
MLLKYILDLKSGKLPVLNEYGKYNVYGSSGIIGKTDFFNSNKESIFIGRVGNCGSLFFNKFESWASDNVIIATLSNSEFILKYIYYFLKTINYKNISIGSTQPLLTQDIIKSINIPEFSLIFQQHIVNII